jgi:hypothetical protein
MMSQIGWALLVTVAMLAAGLAATSRRDDVGAASLVAAILATGGLVWLLRLDLAVLIGLGPLAALAWFAGLSRGGPRAPVRPLVTFGLALPVILLAALLVLTVQQIDWRALPPPRRDLAVSLEAGARLLSGDLGQLLGTGLVLVLALLAATWSRRRSPRIARDER